MSTLKSLKISKYIKLILCHLLLVSVSQWARCQLPKSDVYVVDIDNSDKQISIQNVRYLCDFNQNGYNNQPRLFGNDDIYMTVGLDTNSLTDIYHLDLQTRKYSKVTNTDQISEYSPTKMPMADFFSVVRIESDFETQSLWMYPNNMKNNGSRLLPSLSQVGYHCWLGKDTVALFLVDNPNTLAICNTKTNKVDIVGSNIGRCMRSRKVNTVLFVDKNNPDSYFLKEYDTLEKATTTICVMPKGREDFDFLDNGTILCGDGSKIMAYNINNSKRWTDIIDLSHLKINDINRLHILNKRMVFVNNK